MSVTWYRLKCSALSKLEQQTLAVAASSADLWDVSKRQQHLDHLYNMMSHWKRVYIADAETGKILNSTSDEDMSKLPSNYDARLRDWYHRALVNPGVSVSEIYPDTVVTGEDMISFSTVIRNEDGKLIGVLAADLTRDSLRKSLQEKIADAMTSDRAYRKALSLDEALKELKRGAGKQFDQEMVEVFLTIPRPLLVKCISTSYETKNKPRAFISSIQKRHQGAFLHNSKLLYDIAFIICIIRYFEGLIIIPLLK